MSGDMSKPEQERQQEQPGALPSPLPVKLERSAQAELEEEGPSKTMIEAHLDGHATQNGPTRAPDQDEVSLFVIATASAFS